MNTLHLETMTHDRIAELHRDAQHAHLVRSVSTTAPEPRIPRRGPLAAVARLRLVLRHGAVALA
jgi:hypothetical protein